MSKANQQILSKEEQALFCSLDKAIYPVPNKWGIHGATTFELGKIDRSTILDALDSAYKEVFKIKKTGK